MAATSPTNTPPRTIEELLEREAELAKKGAWQAGQGAGQDLLELVGVRGRFHPLRTLGAAGAAAASLWLGLAKPRRRSKLRRRASSSLFGALASAAIPMLMDRALAKLVRSLQRVRR